MGSATSLVVQLFVFAPSLLCCLKTLLRLGFCYSGIRFLSHSGYSTASTRSGFPDTAPARFPSP
jgi:hypothetical protein